MIPKLNIHITSRQLFEYWFGSTQPCIAQNEFLVNYARTGITTALQALHLSNGSGIGVMVYNCNSVMSAVEKAEHKCVFIDVTDEFKIDLRDLQKKRNDIKALVVTNLYGIRNDIDEVKKIIKEIPIIEDCAQWSETMRDIRTDFQVQSTGAGKNPSLGDGGILRVGNNAYYQTVKELYENLPEYSFKEEVILYIDIIKNNILYNPWVYEVLTQKLKKKRVLSAHPKWTLKRISKGIQRLMSNATIYPMFPMQPILTDNRNEVILKYKQLHIEAAPHFASAIDWAKEYGYNGDCPNAEKIVKRILTLRSNI